MSLPRLGSLSTRSPAGVLIGPVGRLIRQQMRGLDQQYAAASTCDTTAVADLTALLQLS